MNKQKIAKAMPTVLFVTGIAGIFVSEVVVAKDTLKAEKILKEKNITRKRAVEETEELAPGVTSIVGTHLEDKPLKEYVPEVIKATWTCFIPTTILTTLTVSALIASRCLTLKQMALLSSAAASMGSLLTKYRNEIRKIAGDEILEKVDKEVASTEILKAKPVHVYSSHLATTESFDTLEDGEFLFFDPFTKVKFRTTKLAACGARYYLNRNFAIGGECPLSMFYAFLGLDLPEEYSYAKWDVTDMEQSGYYWIDIDFIKSTEPDPETGEQYYIIEYDFLPGDMDDNYYPYGNPLNYEGSYAK